MRPLAPKPTWASPAGASGTTVGTTSAASKFPAAASRGDFNSQPEWGHKVKESRGGNLEVWVHKYGEGNRIFTFVIRA